MTDALRVSGWNGLGRLKQVTENAKRSSTAPPSAPNNDAVTTLYGYDALDNLTSVTPPSDCGTPAGACAGRSFQYTSLKRLTSATNPENGQITYTYDANGNLQTRTSGGITTTYSYDELDELTGKTYSDSSLSASYNYNKGWRTSAVFGNTTYAYNGFDGLGRVTYAMQTTNGHPYTFSFCPNGLSGFNCIGASGYNLIDEVASMTLPPNSCQHTTCHGPYQRRLRSNGRLISNHLRQWRPTPGWRTPATFARQRPYGADLLQRPPTAFRYPAALHRRHFLLEHRGRQRHGLPRLHLSGRHTARTHRPPNTGQRRTGRILSTRPLGLTQKQLHRLGEMV